MAMNGIGRHQEWRTRIKVQQEMANKYNEKFDELESQGADLEEIPKIIEAEQTQLKTTLRQGKTLPFDVHTEVIGIGNNLVQGYDQAHKALSSTKDMYQKADIKYKLMQAKKKGQLTPEQIKKLECIYNQNSIYLVIEEEMEGSVKDQDKKMKEEIYKDHIVELLDAKQKAQKSNYQANYLFTKEMQEECDNQNFDFHQRKNDLKQYSEAYAMCKTTMRK